MAALFLSLHILVAIVFVGSITVVASLFPRYARQAVAATGQATDRGPDLGIAAVLQRVTRTYALAALSVPVLGIVTAIHLHVLGETWVLVSTALTVVAGLVLALAVVPGQRRVLAGIGEPAGGAALLPRLAMVTGVFNLIWVAVVVLMVLRPGSTTLVHP